MRLLRWLRGGCDDGFSSGLHGRKYGWLCRRIYMRLGRWLGCWKSDRLLRRSLYWLLRGLGAWLNEWL